MPNPGSRYSGNPSYARRQYLPAGCSGRCNDRASGFVRQQFEGEGGTVHYFTPAAGVPGLGDPSLPKLNGSAEKLLGFVDRHRNSTAKLLRQVTKHENSRLTFAQGELRHDGAVDRLEGLLGGETEYQRS
jgi:hypothetical protein